jgi:hypothetical protein
MTPPPIKPMPETIFAATREGSRTSRPSARISVNPYFEIRMISAEAHEFKF